MAFKRGEDIMPKYTANGAVFSPDRTYRYTLWRVWGEGPFMHFILLNPSTANENNNDPTVERCERRARRWGFGGMNLTNIFAYRSTSPWTLYKIKDPVGPENDKYILQAVKVSNRTICGWGGHGKHLDRHNKVKELVKASVVYALRINKSGIPSHPLYLNYNLEPFPIFNNTKPWKSLIKKVEEFE